LEAQVTHMGERANDWNEVCSRVLTEFTLPKLRLLCWFDDAPCIYPVCPESYRGVFQPIGTRGNSCWPEHIRREMVRQDGVPRHDALIYLPGRSCGGDTVLFVIAFAHELQHLDQWAASPALFVEGQSLLHRLRELRPSARDWELPAERDATITSKRVAEDICGPIVVSEFVNKQISGGSDVEYWEFFLGFSPATAYNWIRETEHLRPKS
jgi:hypothetical protein